jgi:hypothetical protein
MRNRSPWVKLDLRRTMQNAYPPAAHLFLMHGGDTSPRNVGSHADYIVL